MVPSHYHRRVVAALVLCLCASASSAHAGSYNHLSLSNEAIAGFDVVSYWRKGTPEPGTRAFSVEWKGSVWLFASAADMRAFEKEPTRYAPEFGGYCSYAMSQGIQADIHPYVFRIEGGKLYLFYSFESRDKFLADRGLEQRAEDEWQVLSERIF